MFHSVPGVSRAKVERLLLRSRNKAPARGSY